MKLKTLALSLCIGSLGAMDQSKIDQTNLDAWLLSAAQGGDIERVEQLLKRGANVNAIRKIQKDTALHVSIFFGHMSVTKLLIQNKANIFVQDGFGYTPLHDAVSKQDIELTKLLIAHKADVNAKTQDGHTPLHLAVSTNNPQLVHVLCKAGANLNAQDRYGATPLCEAVKLRKTKVVSELLKNKNIDVSMQDRSGETPLHWAGGNLKLNRMLVDAGAQVDITDRFGYSPLNLALFNKFMEVAALLKQSKNKTLQNK